MKTLLVYLLMTILSRVDPCSLFLAPPPFLSVSRLSHNGFGVFFATLHRPNHCSPKLLRLSSTIRSMSRGSSSKSDLTFPWKTNLTPLSPSPRKIIETSVEPVPSTFPRCLFSPPWKLSGTFLEQVLWVLLRCLSFQTPRSLFFSPTSLQFTWSCFPDLPFSCPLNRSCSKVSVV